MTIFEAFGGRIADTPALPAWKPGGRGSFSRKTWNTPSRSLRPIWAKCQFTGCSHRSEKGCAVRAALAAGELSQTRYDSYCAMYDEVKDVKDWEQPKWQEPKL